MNKETDLIRNKKIIDNFSSELLTSETHKSLDLVRLFLSFCSKYLVTREHLLFPNYLQYKINKLDKYNI